MSNATGSADGTAQSAVSPAAGASEGGLSPRPAAAALLSRYLGNVKKDVTNPKYRRIRIANDKFAATVWTDEAARNLLEFAGWRTDIEEGFLVLPVGVRPDVMEMLLAEHLPPAAAAAAATAGPAAPSPALASGPRAAPADAAGLDERTAKQIAIDEDRKKLLLRLKKEKERKRLLKQQMEADRENVAGRVNRASVRVDAEFGSRVHRYADVGVDLNSGGG